MYTAHTSNPTMGKLTNSYYGFWWQFAYHDIFFCPTHFKGSVFGHEGPINDSDRDLSDLGVCVVCTGGGRNEINLTFHLQF